MNKLIAIALLSIIVSGCALDQRALSAVEKIQADRDTNDVLAFRLGRRLYCRTPNVGTVQDEYGGDSDMQKSWEDHCSQVRRFTNRSEATFRVPKAQ